MSFPVTTLIKSKVAQAWQVALLTDNEEVQGADGGTVHVVPKL